MRMSAQIAEACYMKETDSAEAAAQKYQNQSRKYSQRNQHQNTVKIVENFQKKMRYSVFIAEQKMIKENLYVL